MPLERPCRSKCLLENHRYPNIHLPMENIAADETCAGILIPMSQLWLK